MAPEAQAEAETRAARAGPAVPEFPYHPDPRKTGLDRRSSVPVHALRARVRLRVHRAGVRRRRVRRRAAVPLVHRRWSPRCGSHRVHRRRRGRAGQRPGPRARRDHRNARPASPAGSRSTGSTTAATAPRSSGRPRPRGRPRTAFGAAIAASASLTPTLRRTVLALRAAASGTTIRRSDRPGPLGPIETAANHPFKSDPAASAMTATTQRTGRERPPSSARTLRHTHT